MDAMENGDDQATKAGPVQAENVQDAGVGAVPPEGGAARAMGGYREKSQASGKKKPSGYHRRRHLGEVIELTAADCAELEKMWSEVDSRDRAALSELAFILMVVLRGCQRYIEKVGIFKNRRLGTPQPMLNEILFPAARELRLVLDALEGRSPTPEAGEEAEVGEVSREDEEKAIAELVRSAAALPEPEGEQ